MTPKRKKNHTKTCKIIWLCNSMWWWMLTKLIVVLFSQSIHISNHYVVHIKRIQYTHVSIFKRWIHNITDTYRTLCHSNHYQAQSKYSVMLDEWTDWVTLKCYCRFIFLLSISYLFFQAVDNFLCIDLSQHYLLNEWLVRKGWIGIKILPFLRYNEKEKT